jgi:periplasmic protein TonB
MFEDSTFESTGRICTRSREWMAATFAFNSSILLALILIPLWLTQALPRITSAIWMEAPQAPQPVTSTPAPPKGAVIVQRQVQGNIIFAPILIPRHPLPPGPPEVLGDDNLAHWAQDNSTNGANPFEGANARPIVTREPAAPVRVSSPVVAGLLIHRVVPVYPPIARATHMQGTVVLEAIISKRGTIENLHVVSGPPLLVQAALDAVSTWLYRPYLLNGEPVEVETTVNVNFTLE